MKFQSTQTLKRLQEDIVETQKELAEATAELFPVGSRISWYYRGIYQQFGTVIRVSEDWWSEMYLIAENEHTGKQVTVWLHMRPEPLALQ